MKTRKTLATRNLWLVIFESAITSGLISMSIMTPYFYSLGLNNAEIALSQAMYTVMTMGLNLPTGFLADHLSRKWANVIGDFGCACGFLLYASAQSFIGVVFCECWLGVFRSLSQGVDFSLLRHFSYQRSKDETSFRKECARLTFWQEACTLLMVLLGGPIGAIDFRLAVAISGVPFIFGGIAGLFVQDDSEKLQPVHNNPLRDMLRIVKSSFRQPRLRTKLFAYAIGREMTHGIIWVLTPILMLAGVPLSVVSIAWVIDSLMRITGSRLASRFAGRLKTRQIFAIPLVLMAISMLSLSITINLWTVSTYLLMGIVCGWTGATLMPLLQKEVPPAEQTTVISLAKVMGQALYIPVSLIIGWLADFQLRYVALATILIFLPPGLMVLRKLPRE